MAQPQSVTNTSNSQASTDKKINRTQSAKVIIIGTGFGGIAAAYYLQNAGIHDFIILERADDVGGVWRDNSYPGCACDVQSHLYSFSFALNPNWSREYSPQAEIKEYIQKTTSDLGLMPHIQFNQNVVRMDWQEGDGKWLVQTDQGTFEAQHVIGGFGSLSDPNIPNIDGLQSFEGDVFHSATWPKDFSHKNKKIAVIGTGASALQFIPAIQPDVNELHVFQRTPSWVLPRHDHAIPYKKRQSYQEKPRLMKMERLKIYSNRETWALGFLNPVLMKNTQRKALKHMRGAIKDKKLRAKLTPDYTIGCKRILISNTYYPALAQKNVELHTNGIKSINKNSITTNDGATHNVDAIVFGTGFKVKDLPFSHYIYDDKGVSLADSWQGTPTAYMGTSIHGYPNLYLLHGPNTALGHTSVIIMMEAQAQHVVKVIKHADTKANKIIEPTKKAQDDFVNDVYKRMRGTVWVNGGCASWYLDNNGNNSTIWPNFTFAFKKMANDFKAKDYQTR